MQKEHFRISGLQKFLSFNRAMFKAIYLYICQQYSYKKLDLFCCFWMVELFDESEGGRWGAETGFFICFFLLFLREESNKDEDSDFDFVFEWILISLRNPSIEIE